MRNFISVFLLSCLIGLTQAPAATLRLALNWKPEPQFGGFYAAESNSFFRNAALDVQIIPGGSGTPTVQMLAAHKTEYAIVSADEVILAHDRGSKDVVALFAAFQTNPQGLMFRANKSYASIKDILSDKDSTLLWQAGLPYALYLIKKYGRPLAKTAPYAGGISALLGDAKINQQCFVTSEPLLAEKSKLSVKSFLIADEGYNPYTTVLVTTKKRLQDHPREVKAMVLAVQKGWDEYLKNPDPTNQLMNKKNPAMDLPSMQKSAEAQKKLIANDDTRKTGLGQMTEARWALLVDQLHDLKLIKTKPQARDLFSPILSAP